SDNYYLGTPVSTIRDPSETAVSLSWLIEAFTEGTGDRPQSILLVLDTCYSGKAGGQTAAIVSQARQHGRFREGSGLWILASADALSFASDGGFVDALHDVIKDDAWMPAGGAPYLNPLD